MYLTFSLRIMVFVSLIFGLILSLPVPSAFAHKVIASAFTSGEILEGEVGFSNGDVAQDILVEVFDPDGEKIGEALTDAEGFFTFRPTLPVKHLFKADLGAGHIANFSMSKDDILRVLAKQQASSSKASPVQGHSEAREEASAPENRPAPVHVLARDGRAQAAIPPELQDMLETAVRNEIRPLRREITAYKEKNDLQAILGGIGYIFGFFGLGFYLMARQKMKALRS